MKMPPADLRYIAQAFEQASHDVIEHFEDVADPRLKQWSDPCIMAEAMLRIIDFLHLRGDISAGSGSTHDSPPVAHNSISELGDNGLKVLTNMAALAAELDLDDRCAELESLAFPFALWIARHGGDIGVLEPVVNTLARLANYTKDHDELANMCLTTGEIIDATSPVLSQDTEQLNPHDPWRLLLFNRAILATRSHNPALMRLAFDAITESLPTQAAEFFRDGMEQMELLNYPRDVRATMQIYFQRWSVPRVLH